MKKYAALIVAGILVAGNVVLFHHGAINWSPIRTTESLASTLSFKTQEMCASNTLATTATPIPQSSRQVLTVWAETGKLYKNIQLLLPDSCQPQREEDIAYLVGIRRIDTKVGEYEDNQPGYEIDYRVQLIQYRTGQEIEEVIIKGSQPPFTKTGSGPAYGSAPTDGSIATWIKDGIGVANE